jgi:large subunit ribosomal protein L6
MSRIGKLPISIPEGVSIQVKEDNTVEVKGPLGTLTQKVDPDMKVKIEDGNVEIVKPTDSKRHRSFHGLYRSLIANMVEGVSKGFEVKQELVGVGYKATTEGQLLELNLGYSHPIFVELPKEVSVEAVTERRSNPIITLKSIDKQLIGQVAAKIRSLRPPEPYKGKGIKFVGEEIRRKAGKAGATS